ncbi:MAG: thermonuclease family protein [Sulfuriferula multivorans]|uniref:Thermonuclease family protein n=1 Tax=Sulfuriferula multivorans TaxID=1559896 RepID=A0A7C9KAS5_9PROT|nr:thermonuclease family protein [Sulfuriferula multivorans]
MRRYLGVIATTCTLMITTASADTFTGRVVEVTDGDTLTLLIGRQHRTINLTAIDAPERYQAWGDPSRTNLSRLALNRNAVATCTELKQRGELVCKLVVNQRDIGLEQIQDGMAWWLRQDAKSQPAEDYSAYASAELMAKLKRLGLWRETNPIPPWDFISGH